jgi:hypothetical protein
MAGGFNPYNPYPLAPMFSAGPLFKNDQQYPFSKLQWEEYQQKAQHLMTSLLEGPPQTLQQQEGAGRMTREAPRRSKLSNNSKDAAKIIEGP